MSVPMTNSTRAFAASGSPSNGTPILSSVPMSTTRILAMNSPRGNRTFRQLLLRSTPAYMPRLLESTEMERSYANLGPNGSQSIYSPLGFNTQIIGANILGQLHPPSAPVSLLMARETAGHRIFDSSQERIDFTNNDQVTWASPMGNLSTIDGGILTTPNTSSQPPSPDPSEMPGTPNMTVLREDESEDYSRVDRLVQQLDYDEVHRDEAIQAMRLERLLEAQRRGPREDRTETVARDEAPRMTRSLGMMNREHMSGSAHQFTQSELAGESTAVLLVPRPTHVRALARRRWQDALKWFAERASRAASSYSSSSSSSEAITPTNSVQAQTNVAAEVCAELEGLLEMIGSGLGNRVELSA
ncbi:hypothetical protein FRC12_000598 [Ceratobasidium sp. 428]|nr:hypothetical protein FRC12_000598 [Ceratobasidium sp. 428]